MQIKYDCIQKGAKVRIQGPKSSDYVEISLRRTIRVPNTWKVSGLPSDVGAFPLYKTSDYVDKLPADMAAKGGVFLPIYRE